MPGRSDDMINKILLYVNTVRYLKPSQIYYRIRKTQKKKCRVGKASVDRRSPCVKVATIDELNYDPEFLARYPIEEFMEDQVCFLHEKEHFSWQTPWEFPDRSPLWNFNLHYFDYLMSFLWEYRNTGDRRIMEKAIACIAGWIRQNPVGAGGPGWSAYTISLRLVNWLVFYTELEEELPPEFRQEFVSSIYDQYAYLAEHAEKDILGNHYFENLKTLIMCALFFDDADTLNSGLKEFKKQCKEQILPDGMHFELSPMYHKIILEGMLRVAYALRQAGHQDHEIEAYLPKMVDVAFSLEKGLNRLPLFNDCGGNVAKSLNALMEAARRIYGIVPVYRKAFPDSGYYIFEAANWKMIVDAGKPGPDYIPGHAHCDGMSFELFCHGEPVIVNCGTYAYQCEERSFFRSTSAHNTVMANNTEQSQCWSAFRLARRSRIRIDAVDDTGISMELRDYAGHTVHRRITLTEEKLQVVDACEGCELKSFIHGNHLNAYSVIGSVYGCRHPYSPDYGVKESVDTIVLCGRDLVQFSMEIGDSEYGCNETI